ncbi:MAG: hypothetical protein ACYTFG_12030, partial [Planctomycetota bacterium]
TIDVGAREGKQYLLRGDRLEKAALSSPNGPGLKGAEDLPDFDFFWLEELEFQEARGLPLEVPADLRALDGKKVRAVGFIQGRDAGPPSSFVLGKSFWDDCCTGTPPTYFNSILVVPGDSTPIPPPWVERGAFAGVLKLSEGPAEWPQWGVARIEGAYEVPSGAFRGGPHIPLWIEAFVFALALVLSMRKRPGPVAGGCPSPHTGPPGNGSRPAGEDPAGLGESSGDSGGDAPDGAGKRTSE